MLGLERRHQLRFISLTLAALLAGCARQPAKPKDPPMEYTMRGEVKAVDPKNQLATVDHEKIEGWMGAMTMDYPVKNQHEFSKLRVGSRIEAKVVVQDLEYWLADIKEMPVSSTPASAAPVKMDSKK